MQQQVIRFCNILRGREYLELVSIPESWIHRDKELTVLLFNKCKSFNDALKALEYLDKGDWGKGIVKSINNSFI